MAFELMPLPYDREALAPAISAETLGFHHGKHHKAYIDKTNAAIEGTPNADKSLEEIIAAARGYVDEVIKPSETRPRLIRSLEILADKRETNPRKKHGNIPL